MVAASNYGGCLSKGMRIEAAITQTFQSKGWGFAQSKSGIGKLAIKEKICHTSVEYRGTPFRMAKQFVNLDPDEALPINHDKIDIMPNDTVIFIVVDFGKNKGLYSIKKDKVMWLMREYPERHYTYKPRGKGHSASSFYVKVSDCQRQKHLEEIFNQYRNGA